MTRGCIVGVDIGNVEPDEEVGEDFERVKNNDAKFESLGIDITDIDAIGGGEDEGVRPVLCGVDVTQSIRRGSLTRRRDDSEILRHLTHRCLAVHDPKYPKYADGLELLALHRNLDMFRRLCGRHAEKILATTKWSVITEWRAEKARATIEESGRKWLHMDRQSLGSMSRMASA
ncbi:hypothetical protein DFH29DRAFT_1033132 [Suillus ampliporus]|nr:hypothetical protein DFH29DRAFT_1033132 [Suillus ampliporus]